MIERDRVVSGNLRPFMPMALGANVEYSLGSWLSGSQRMTPSPRVQPLLMTARKSSLSTSAVSASSMIKQGAHFVMLRKSAGPLMETFGNPHHTKKLMTLSKVVLPESFSAEVANNIGLWVASVSCWCSHEKTIHSATATT